MPCSATAVRGTKNGSFPLDCHISHLFFLQGRYRLFALDVASGRCLWTCWAPGSRFGLAPPAGCFDRSYAASEYGIVLRTGRGQRCIRDSRTGRSLSTSGAVHGWTSSAVPLDDRRVAEITDAQHVVLLDTLSGKELWTHDLDAPVSLTGEPPQLLGDANSLLLLSPRSYGSLLENLDLEHTSS